MKELKHKVNSLCGETSIGISNWAWSGTAGYKQSTSKKLQIVSEISIECDQTHLGMLLTNWITEFMNFQYLQNKSRDKTDFLDA